MNAGRALVVLATATSLGLSATTAHADVRLGSPRYTACPGITGDSSKYRGEADPYRCHSAVLDPDGTTVILRQGRSGPDSSAFGFLHAQMDHGVDALTIERVVSSSEPRPAPKHRVRYSADLRVAGNDAIAVWVEVSRQKSNDAPDDEPFGVLTAYCKYPSKSNFEKMCPDWVEGTM